MNNCHQWVWGLFRDPWYWHKREWFLERIQQINPQKKGCLPTIQEVESVDNAQHLIHQTASVSTNNLNGEEESLTGISIKSIFRSKRRSVALSTATTPSRPSKAAMASSRPPFWCIKLGCCSTPAIWETCTPSGSGCFSDTLPMAPDA